MVRLYPQKSFNKFFLTFPYKLLMLYCSERANTHIEHGAKGAYREIRSYNRYLQPTGIIKRMRTTGSVADSSLFLYLYSRQQ